MLGSGGAGGSELAGQGSDGCRAVSGWQCGEVGFQSAQHQRAVPGADGGQPAQGGESGGDCPVQVTGRDCARASHATWYPALRGWWPR
jgi:hypothetical protein